MDLSPPQIEFRPGILSRLLRQASVRSIRLDPEGVSCRSLRGGGAATRFRYDALASTRAQRGRIWGTIVFVDGSGGRLLASGFRNRTAERVVAAVKARSLLQASRDRLESLVAWAASHRQLAGGTRFISRWELGCWIERWSEVAAWGEQHFTEIEEGLPLLAASLGGVRRLWTDPDSEADRINDAFVGAEVVRHAALFDDINGRSLTAQQREIAVRNDTDLLVIAGAGTGKTQAIAGKVAYLVRAGLARPEEILIVAFNTKAAEELQDRAGRVGGAGIQARTFHALGHRILGCRPILEEAKDEAGMAALVQELVEPLRADPRFESTLAELTLLYREPLTPTVSCEDFPSYVCSVKSSSLRAHKGRHRVKNGEELRIANWLFLHGLEYEYERVHPQPESREVPGGERAGAAQPRPGVKHDRHSPVYKPTFYLPQWDVWLAHRALDARGDSPVWYPDRAEYLKEIGRTRAWHAQRPTRLAESYSWWFLDDLWELRLRRALEEAGVSVPRPDWATLLARMAAPEHGGLADRSLHWFRQTVARYLQLLSEGGHDAEAVFSRAACSPDPRRILLFKQLCAPVWSAYQQAKESRGRIDFADMIRLSRDALTTGRWAQRFTHIIVDEYQDVSRSKMELLMALRALTPGSSLTCVGDDWQAINRFAGGDLGLMTGFASQVGGKPWETRLDSTFRFGSAIAEVSGWFVQNNPAQINKSLRSGVTGGSGEIVSMHIPHASPDDLGPVIRALDEINTRAAPGATVCILGRYRRLLGEGQATAESFETRYPQLRISLSTVHKYKGKEADWVVVGWLTDDRQGFPCLRHDDPIMAELLPESERYPFAEERRLFYVALTRARHGLYLVCDSARPSPFVIEIERAWAARGRIKIVTLGKAPNLPCPTCREGALVPRSGKHGLFYSCQNAPACGYREPACPACGTGMMVADGDMLTCSDGACGHQLRRCPQCGTGRLVPRQNASTKEWFLGCSRFSDEAVRCRYTIAT